STVPLPRTALAPRSPPRVAHLAPVARRPPGPSHVRGRAARDKPPLESRPPQEHRPGETTVLLGRQRGAVGDERAGREPGRGRPAAPEPERVLAARRPDPAGRGHRPPPPPHPT